MSPQRTRFLDIWLPVYFSTLERLRITQGQDYQEIDNSGQESSDSLSFALSCDEEDRPPLRLGFGQDELENAPHRRPQGNALRIYASPGNRLSRNRYASCDQLRGQSSGQSMISDATEESILRMGKRQLRFESLPRSSTSPKPNPGSMVSLSANATTAAPDLKSTADSMYESFRWLEEEEDLDLKLCLDDHHFNLRGEDVLAEKHRPSFRRHMSISKLPFSSRASSTLSRPTTKDTSASPPLMGSPVSSPSSPILGHVRRRSRALSLISPNKQPVPDASVSIDAAAAHYQDPDARMKLRVYLASPHKFDEAVEFGFPSIEEVQSSENYPRRKRASLSQGQSTNSMAKSNGSPEDDKSSVYSDGASTKEPESPRTPEMEKSLSVKPVRVSQEKDDISNTAGYAQAPAACREMTLRMTLTRPDLRANEDQIYGWQKTSNGRKSQARDEPLSPVSTTREGHSKESIERQLATMDQEDLLANDNGVMKRFWNRVRRS
ncbi:hypothetical protein MHUMG1_06435 [Metarhizium humberi]|uniref:Mucin n=1 Tax=Metarhizium humberi TaxID=2596975 RepID=A0A9P8M744_9HYPO|nr:hypothetical protein MHUMG1_06435 [Metarhizium humberi]